MQFLKCSLIILTVSNICFSTTVLANDSNSDTNSLLHHYFKGKPLPKPSFDIENTGDTLFIDYSHYGEFSAEGTPGFHYRITDRKGLKNAIGAGIYPNNIAIKQESHYTNYAQSNALSIGHWDVFKDADTRRAFYVWAMAPDAKGTKLFFTALLLERAGHIEQAIKAYYASLIHAPKQSVWAASKDFVWYTAPGAVSAIKRLCSTYPELECDLQGAQVDMQNTKDIDLSNDIIAVNPGRIVRRSWNERFAQLPDLSQIPIERSITRGDIQLHRYTNGHWQMLVDEKPFVVRGVTYGPTEIGLGPQNDLAFSARWMQKDKNNNGQIDAAYDAWVDKNGNGKKDPDEPAVGDFQLMKDMGVNAIRYYIPTAADRISYDSQLVNKPLLRDMYYHYGIRLIAGDMLGAYTVGSGADWESGTDYTNPLHRKRMLDVLKAKVLDLKDEPFLLMWVLGNENNLPKSYSGVNATKTNAGENPQAYAEFLNEAAALIHQLDGKHPVAVGNLGTGLVDYYHKYAPNIDIMGVNSYQGPGGFGMVWETVRDRFDRPVLITEYGCDAYATDEGEDEDAQRQYHEGNLRDIVLHQAGGPFTGNSIGGIVFQFMDEWWKDTHNGSVDEQQTASTFAFPFPDGYSNEEWFGIVSQGSGKNSPFERHLRSTYFFYQDAWSRP